jgi:hypothetical protein
LTKIKIKSTNFFKYIEISKIARRMINFVMILLSLCGKSVRNRFIYVFSY